jgi:hypothetical protein
MPSIKLKNFKFGLDTRRSELTSVLGTLAVLQDGHVTQGGEIARRYAFVRTALPANTFGLESTSSGKITFGSIADPGGWPIGTVVGYQRLQHPAVLDGAVYDAAKHAMTAVPFSCPFKGKAFVVATFADGYTFCYYDGVLVEQSRRGMVLSGLTATNELAEQLAAAFSGVSGFTATATSNSVEIVADEDLAFTLDVSEESTAGTIAAAKISDETEGEPAEAAIGSFRMSEYGVNATNGQITSITVNAVEIYGTSVGTVTPTKVANQINSYVSTPKYTAEARDDFVYIYADPEQGDALNGATVQITTIVGGPMISVGRFILPDEAVGTTCDSILVGAIELLTSSVELTSTRAAWAAAIIANINANSGVSGYKAGTGSGAVGEVSIGPLVSTQATTATISVDLSAGTIINNNLLDRPTSLTLTVLAAGIRLDGDTNADASSYHFYRSLDSDDGFAEVSETAVAPPTYEDGATADGIRYYYYYTYENNSGETKGSLVLSGRRDQTTTGVTSVAISYPTGGQKPFLTWSPKAEASGYIIKRSTTPGGPYTAIGSSTVETYIDTDVTLGVDVFYYVVVAVVNGTELPNSPEVGIGLFVDSDVAPFLVKLNRTLIIGRSNSEKEVISVHAHDPAANATAIGGNRPYTFEWIALQNEIGATMNRPDNNRTSFRCNVPKGNTLEAVFYCKVTDASGDVANSAPVVVRFIHD